MVLVALYNKVVAYCRKVRCHRGYLASDVAISFMMMFLLFLLFFKKKRELCRGLSPARVEMPFYENAKAVYPAPLKKIKRTCFYSQSEACQTEAVQYMIFLHISVLESGSL